MLGRQRPPGWLPNIPLLSRELLPSSAIAGHCGQYSSSANLGCVENHLAIRGNAGGFVEPRISERPHLPGRDVLYRNIEAIPIAVNKGETFTIRAVLRAYVVAALKCETLGCR